VAAGFDIDCERELIAAMLQKEKYLLEIISEVTPEDFTQDSLRQLFLIITDMYNANRKVTVQSVLTENREEVKKIDFGMSYIMLTTQLISGGIKSRIDRLHETTKIRKLLRISDDIRELANDDAKSEQILQSTETSLSELDSTGIERVYTSPIQLADNCLNVATDMRNEEKRNKQMLYTSFKKLNEISGGFSKGDLIILSAQTGVGKSAFAMNIAKEIGIVQKRPIFYLNSEMGASQMALRWDSYMAKVSHKKLRNGTATDEEMQQINDILSQISSGQVHTLTIPDLQISNVTAEVRRAKSQYGIEVCIVDYIGRMDCSNAAKKDDWKILKSAAMKLKTMAQSLNMVVIMLAQLTDGETLAQSSQMKQEADLWLNLKEIEKDDQPAFAPWNILAEIRKARNADKSHAISMRFNGDILTFTDDKTIALDWYSDEQGEPAAQFGAIVSQPGQPEPKKKSTYKRK